MRYAEGKIIAVGLDEIVTSDRRRVDMMFAERPNQRLADDGEINGAPGISRPVNYSGGEICRQDAQKTGQTHRQYSVWEILCGKEGGEEGDAIDEEKRGAKDDANCLLNPFLRRVTRGQDLRAFVLRAPSRHHFIGVFVTDCVAVGIIFTHGPLDDLVGIQMRHFIFRKSVRRHFVCVNSVEILFGSMVFITRILFPFGDLNSFSFEHAVSGA